MRLLSPSQKSLGGLGEIRNSPNAFFVSFLREKRKAFPQDKVETKQNTFPNYNLKTNQ
jgi:hypothetical protein